MGAVALTVPLRAEVPLLLIPSFSDPLTPIPA